MGDDLRIVGPFHASSGYAKFCRAALTSARLAGFRVQAVESDYKTKVRGFTGGGQKWGKIALSDTSKLPDVQREELEAALSETVAPDAPTLFCQLPVQLAGWGDYSLGPRLGWTMVESDTLHPLWARAASNVDGLLLPSAYVAETFRRALPGVSMDVLGLPVDDRIYSPDGPRAAIGGRPDFLFFSNFTTVERKGWRVLMQAFTEEFPGESVGLFLLPSRSEEVIEFAASCRTAGAWIQIFTEWVSEEDLAGLYRACDAFALPSAEGFGLPFVEAALCGKPSVAIDLGGSAAMVTPQTGYPVRSEFAPCVGHLPPVYDSTMQAPTASVGAVRRALRACVEDRAAKGEAARQWALAKFTPEAVAPWLREALEETVCRFETQRSVWQGADVKELPPVTCIVRVSSVERAEACAEWLRQSSSVVRVEFAVAEADGFSFEYASYWLGETILAAQSKAVEDLKRWGFKGFVVVIDDSVEVSSGWWEGLAKLFSLCPEVGLLSPKVLLQEGAMKRCGRRLHFDGTFEVGTLERTVSRCDAPDSALVAIRPEVWQTIEFDPRFPWHYGLIDLAAQARKVGFETAATAQVVVTSTESPEVAKVYLRDEERRAFLRKWKGVG